MKKQYLFLYPVREYFEALGWGEHYCNPNAISNLMNIIDARYRNQEYGINWLLFSQNADNSLPDLDHVPEEIGIQRNDRLIVAGVSFDEHTTNLVYPGPNYILNQLDPHLRLVLGGFHQDDCVNKVAAVSYRRGVDTFVDEDTTHLGFGGLVLGHEVPVVRTDWTLRGLGKPIGDKAILAHILKMRKDKPWLVREVG